MVGWNTSHVLTFYWIMKSSLNAKKNFSCAVKETVELLCVLNSVTVKTDHKRHLSEQWNGESIITGAQNRQLHTIQKSIFL